MGARLVQIVGPGKGASFALGGASTVIGRDPEADLCVPSERISRRHAVVRTVGDRHELTDLGSLNGTRLNGRSLEGSARLSSGDRIELADAITLGYQVGGGGLRRGLMLTLLLAVAAAGVAGGWSWWRSRPDPSLDHAAVIARGAVEAWRRGDADAARRGLQTAAGVLYTAGHLDQVPRGRALPRAFALIEVSLAEPVDLDAILHQALQAQADALEARAQARQRAEPADARACRLDQITPAGLDACLAEWTRQVMIGLRQDPDAVPDDFHRTVAARIKRERGFLERSLRRGEAVVPMLREELERSRMPPLLHYVALIESGYRNAAGSEAGAVGIWQFMPGTARQYGLQVGDELDERTDPQKSTHAAARYLRDLVFEFGGNAMLLALASYNRGENAVRRALKRLDDPFSDRSYWRLVDESLLPTETTDYVPRFIAAAVVGEGGLPPLEVLEEAGY